jgi:hypothetical protein
MTKLLLMFIDSFHDTVAVWNYIASDDKRVVKDELDRIRKAAAVR